MMSGFVLLVVEGRDEVNKSRLRSRIKRRREETRCYWQLRLRWVYFVLSWFYLCDTLGTAVVSARTGCARIRPLRCACACVSHGEHGWRRIDVPHDKEGIDFRLISCARSSPLFRVVEVGEEAFFPGKIAFLVGQHEGGFLEKWRGCWGGASQIHAVPGCRMGTPLCPWPVLTPKGWREGLPAGRLSVELGGYYQHALFPCLLPC